MKVPILIPNIFDHPFTYDSNSLNLDKGNYVAVPFGSTKITGIVLDKFEKALVLAKKYDNGITEIISHPGDIIASEKKVWKNKNLIDNYFSKNRIIEKNVLSNKKLKKK